MNDPFERMVLAVVGGLFDGERRELSSEILRKTCRICADVALAEGGSPEEIEPPAMHWIKAWLIRPNDMVWDPEVVMFKRVVGVQTTDAGLVRLSFSIVGARDPGDGAWFQTAEDIQVAVHPGSAVLWNERCRSFDGETVDLLIKVHAPLAAPDA